MAKCAITYIGNKDSKRDTVAGTKLIFPRGQAIPVDEALVPQFLEFPNIWVLAEDADKALAEKTEQQQAVDEAKAQALQAAEEQVKAQSYLVLVDGEELDIGKYSVTQLDTLVEGQNLVIDVKKKPVQTYRLAIRDALRQLSQS